MMNTYFKPALAAVWLCAALPASAVPVLDGVTSVSPASATQGDVAVQVSMTLASGTMPPAPPDNVHPQYMIIGNITNTPRTIVRTGNNCTAMFNIPPDTPPGLRPVVVFFEDDPAPPPELSFIKENAFEILPVAAGPVVAITSANGVVSNAVTTLSVSGTNSLDVVGFLTWSNEVTGASGTFPAASPWITPAIDLYVGDNPILVSGTNESGTAGFDRTLIGRLPAAGGPVHPYPIVDTAQFKCFDTHDEITPPAPGDAFYGQDAQLPGAAPKYMQLDGGTVLDLNTGLEWTRSPDTDRNGQINAADKMTLDDALAYATELNASNYAGHADWRVPGIKELYSLIDFSGGDPSAYTDTDTTVLVPFINSRVFGFAYGDQNAGERIIDAQFVSTNLYVDTSNEELLFGVNFADGRIKGYSTLTAGIQKTFYVLCCRGNPGYCINQLVDNGNGTISDLATGLMWDQNDSGAAMTWESALAWVETLNGSHYCGYSDWRLPNIKELQSILDYTRSPGTTASAAIDPLFHCTSILNEENILDWGYYWSGTTHKTYEEIGDSACYMAFGRGLGYMNGEWKDVHGAGCQRSDPKTGSPGYGGPQGDARRISNFVRAVRDIAPIDTDADGMCNSDELIAGTDPFDSGSLFEVVLDETEIHWSSAWGKTYALESTGNLAFGSWTTYGIYAATPPENTTTVTNTPNQLFYRVRTIPAPVE